MQKINDEKRIRGYISRYHLKDFFTELPSFELFSFEKNEVLNRRLNPTGYILFLVSGSCMLSNTKIDGSIYAISEVRAFTCFGDVEFVSDDQKQFEITTDSVCEILALDLSHWRETLQKDPLFLQYLLTSVVRKFRLLSAIYSESTDLESRLIHYISQHSEEGNLRGVERTANELGCSRRQLQRILVKLCQEKRMIKTGKGAYRLI